MSALSIPPALPEVRLPLHWDQDVWRVGTTNLTLEAVVQLYETGLDVEEIAREFEGLELATVYQVIGYYLSHRAEFAEYLASRRAHLAARREHGKATAREMRAWWQARE